MIEIVASMTLPEYREVCHAITPRSRRRISKTGLRVLTVVCLSLCFFVTVLSPLDSLLKLELLLLPYLLLGAFRIYLRRAIGNSYKQQQTLLQNQTMRIDETGIAGSCDGGTITYRYAWTAFEQCIELKSGLVYLLPAAGFVRVPCAALSAEEQARIRTWSADIPHELR